jgi:spore coat polysaccharide biosynthesis protein SpsF (cytidylyltransferase family)
MTRTVAVVQARLGSHRFPGKMLTVLGEHSLLEWVVTRVGQSDAIDRVVVATTLEPLDDQIVAECGRLGVDVVRGSTDDVLDRFMAALADDKCDTVVRVCADNPFVDASCITAVIDEHRSTGADYSFNHRPFGVCNYADGFGVEVISRVLLTELHSQDLSAEHREHVTLAIADGTVKANVHGCVAPPSLARPELRFDIDEPQDLQHLQALVAFARLHIGSSAAKVVAAEISYRATHPS